MKKFLLIFGLLALATLLVIGGCTVNKKTEKEELLEIVKSKEAKELFERELKVLDSKALTEGGVIQSYRINYDSVEKNPMGGIMVTLYVNNDKKLDITFIINKDLSDNTLHSEGESHSGELEKLLVNF